MTNRVEIESVLGRLSALHPKIIDLTLDRVVRLLAALDHPERRLPPVVHVAGTNGKGSVCAYLRSVLEAAGYRVHAYTNPHLVYFNERIRLNGRLIDDAALVEVLEETERANAAHPITFFEITTVAAFLAFSRVPSDVLVLETGLGGRLDATNVLEAPVATVITPIDLDHQGYLGETIGRIAGEKAGILKPGVPAIVARQNTEALAVLEARALDLGAPLFRAGVEWGWRETDRGFELSDGLNLPRPALPGHHQIDNAALAMETLTVLEAGGHFRVSAAARAEGLGSVQWPARLQRLTEGPLVDRIPPNSALWLDGGHNPHAGRAIAPLVREWAGQGPVDMICGMIETKDPVGYLAPLASFIRSLVVVPIAGGQTGAGMAPEKLAKAAMTAGFSEVRVTDGFGAALDLLNAPTILIGGSLYLAGDVLRENGTAVI